MNHATMPIPVRCEFILGGQKSGKTRRAEYIAQQWMQATPARQAIYLATGQAWDEEMQARIHRHQSDRAIRVPGMLTIESPLYLAQAVQAHSAPDTLLVVDCLTMWLTNWMMPTPAALQSTDGWPTQRKYFLEVLSHCSGPVVIVGNEIGLGVIPMGHEVRSFVDALGILNQDVAHTCQRVTLMVAGLPMQLK